MKQKDLLQRIDELIGREEDFRWRVKAFLSEQSLPTLLERLSAHDMEIAFILKSIVLQMEEKNETR